MNKFFASISMCIFCNSLLASTVPRYTEITKCNEEKLGFDIATTVEHFSYEVKFYFPRFVNGTWPAKRAQVFLQDKNGVDLLGASFDYEAGEDHPRIMTNFNYLNNALSFYILYACEREDGGPCVGAVAYGVKSIETFVTEKNTCSESAKR